MTNCMDSTSCTFDLAKTEDYNKAMFLREHVLGTESLVMPYWSEVTLDHKQVRFIQVCSRDLWQLPRAGILRFTFISFQMHEPMPESLLGFILKLLQDTPSDCERARIIRNIFKCPDIVFRLTCAMVKTVLDLFADRETKSQVYPHLKRHTVDLQNSLDFEFGLAVSSPVSKLLLFCQLFLHLDIFFLWPPLPLSLSSSSLTLYCLMDL